MNPYPPGALIAGRYEVAGRSLLGGMGIVYLCLDRETQRPVALKTFRPEFLPDRATRDRFLREGTTWVNLGNHPHIVRAYGVERIGDGREVYPVLEQIAKAQGREDASLRAWLRPGKGLPVEQALLIGLQIARGMRHAAERVSGFVHRDLKPENVLVGADTLPAWGFNRVRVTDFGLAAVLQGQALPEGSDASGADLRKTQLTHGVVGTPLYMAPEQWARADVSAATDVYALGCILYEVLSGEPAVAGRSLPELRRGHSEGRVAGWRGNVPEVVRRLVGRCLRLSPGERYGSWREVEQALGEAWAEVTAQAVPEAEEPQTIERSERVALGWAQSALGASYVDIGKAEVALGYFEGAREVGAAEGEQRLEAAGLSHLGNAYEVLGDARCAVGYHEQALAMTRDIGDLHGQGVGLGNLGNVYFELGDAQAAIVYYEQALAIYRDIDDLHGQGVGLGNLGNAYLLLGEAREAIEYFEQALATYRDIGDRRSEGQALGNQGSAYADLGDAREAIGYYEQALVIAHEIGDQFVESNALAGLGSAYSELGNALRAIEYLEQQLAIARETCDRRGEGGGMDNLGNAYLDLGDAERAIISFEQALAIFRDIGDRYGYGTALGNLGHSYRDLGDARRAIGYYEQALAIFRDIGDRRSEETILSHLGEAYRNSGDVRRAIGYFEQALTIHRDIGARCGEEGKVLSLLGNAYLQLGDAWRAIGYYEQTLAIAREISDRQGEALGSWNLGLAYEHIGDLPRAIVAMQVCVDFERDIAHPDAANDAAKVAALRAELSGDAPPESLPESDV